MFFTHPYYTRSSSGPEERSSVHIPIVYKELPPIRWEYHVLSLDPHEAALPDSSRLNELGREGWILAGQLDERAGNAGKLVHYYFVRQAQD
jgi:hypothetical protein